MRKIFRLLTGFCLLFLLTNVSATDINSCQHINSAGYYRLNTSITNDSGDCIVIDSDDVILDLDNNVVDGDGDDDGYGILAENRDNVTIENGEVREVRLSQGLPQMILNRVAIESARRIRFTPGMDKGVPAAMWVRLTIGFQPR